MRATAPTDGLTTTAGTLPTSGGFEGECAFGEIRITVALDPTLAALWRPRPAGERAAAEIRIDLRAREALHEQVRWFGEGGVATLTGRGCALQRFPSAGGERIEGTCHPTETAVRHALRFGTQPALLRRGWLLVHACAVEISGSVHVFAAPSGTGKSTFARRAVDAGHRLVADEVVLVTPGRAAEHPALPRTTGAAPLPLAAIHFLERGEPQRRPVSQAEACARLLSLSMVYERSPEAARLAFDLAQRIVEGCPSFATRVPDDARAPTVLR